MPYPSSFLPPSLSQGRVPGHLLCAGRPVCDIKTSAKELIRARSYDLSGEWN